MLNIESRTGEVSQRGIKIGLKRIAYPKPSAPQTNAGSATLLAKGILEDSNLYLIDEAVGRLLEVRLAVPAWSPKKHKKTTNIGTEKEGATSKTKQIQSKVRSKANRGIGRLGNAQDRKLVVFNVHGTLVDSSLISDKNPNRAIRATLTTNSRRMIIRL